MPLEYSPTFFVCDVPAVTRSKPREFWFSSPGEIVAMRKKLELTQSTFWSRVGVTQWGGSRYEPGGRKIPRPVKILLQVAYGNEDESATTINHLRAVPYI